MAVTRFFKCNLCKNRIMTHLEKKAITIIWKEEEDANPRRPGTKWFKYSILEVTKGLHEATDSQRDNTHICPTCADKIYSSQLPAPVEEPGSVEPGSLEQPVTEPSTDTPERIS